MNRYDLYELAVQDPATEAAFLRAVHGGDPRVLCEDFCGPASVARAWCAGDPDARAAAIDMDPEPLAHARACAERYDGSHVEPITDRLELVESDVLATRKKADVIAALNFALCELHKRRWLMTYLRGALYRLKAGGVLVADLYGGAGAWAPGVSEKLVATGAGPVKYRWEQREADPVSGMVRNAIHFVLPAPSGGGGKLSEKSRTFEDAFEYDWRLWGIAELREAMLDAGFAATEVYTTCGDGIDGEGNLYVHPFATDEEPGDPEELGENFVAYVVGRVAKRK